MKRTTILIMILLVILPLLLTSKVNYLSEQEYKKLSKAERTAYWGQLVEARTEYMTRKAEAIARQESANKKLTAARSRLEEIESEYDGVYNEVLDYLQVDKNNTAAWKEVEKQINYFNDQLNSFNTLSDNELWQAKKDIYSLRKSWDEYRKDNYAKIPDFQDNILLIENRLTRLEDDLESKRPQYSEDTYSVVKGDYLSKIAGYHFIYDDPSKWGIIYRANRDQIKDPNILNPDQVLKIPRGRPNTWKVYKGECLWKISSYPEVYGTGTKWPLLFRANEDQIKDPDLIYPNQLLEIPRD